MMFAVLNVATAFICIGCALYLIMNPMERETNRLTRFLGKKFFPRLDPDQRQDRMASFAGLVLVGIFVAYGTAFLIKHMSR